MVGAAKLGPQSWGAPGAAGGLDYPASHVEGDPEGSAMGGAPGACGLRGARRTRSGSIGRRQEGRERGEAEAAAPMLGLQEPPRWRPMTAVPSAADGRPSVKNLRA